jgi:ABC-type Fe3+/spermidine/putrescine transport system ATPase subunit
LRPSRRNNSFVGPSGSGKTTLVKMLVDFTNPLRELFFTMIKMLMRLI